MSLKSGRKRLSSRESNLDYIFRSIIRRASRSAGKAIQTTPSRNSGASRACHRAALCADPVTSN